MVALRRADSQAPACAAGRQGSACPDGFTFYATIDSDSDGRYLDSLSPETALMIPASSWARKKLRAPRLPAQLHEVAADCGGFVATRIWGDYRYTPAEYVRWLSTFTPHWAATMDYCCEPEVASVIRDRQRRTTAMAHHFWEHYKHAPWVWVPTVQGWEPDDYRRHARELRPLVDEMADYYGSGSGFRVGIGTLCRRAHVRTIAAIVGIVSAELPGVSLHLWGVKLDALKASIALPGVASVDSAAWSGLFGTDREEWHRSGMTQRAWAYSVALPRYRAKVQATRQRVGPTQAALAL